MTIYNKTSPYYNTSLRNGYLDVLQFWSIPANADDVLYRVSKEYEYRPDLLADKLYKDSGLWWVFAVRNPSVIKDPIFDLAAGVVIYLPKLSVLKTSLGI